MSAFVYRLEVTYPPGSHTPDWEPEDWDPPTWWGDPEDYVNFRWPRVRLYLSATAARKRATLLRQFGATVDVVRSEPIEWPDEIEDVT